MTEPIRVTLAAMPSGLPGAPLRDDELQLYIRTHCNRDKDKAREKDHLLRDALFHDGGIEEMKAKVDTLFESEAVKRRVKRMLSMSRYSNAIKRITFEMSTCYAEPAARSIGGSDANVKAYESLVEAMCLDEEMDHVNQQYNLHRAIWLGPRVRVVNDLPEIVLDTHSAATARVVMHPNDNTQVVALLTRCQHRNMRAAPAKPAAWLLTSAHEWEYLDEDFRPIAGTNQVHGLGVMPWIPISSAKKATPDFWPGDDGEDLVAAHVTGWLVEALMVKETKTATKVPVLSGDVTALARQQTADAEGGVELPEGSSMTTVDLGTDIDVYITAADHALERAGNNVGLSMDTLRNQGATSADAREMQLAPVRERRRKQVKVFRRVERMLASLLAALTAARAEALKFDAVEWRIDFGEPQVLLSKKERLEIFETERRLGLDNTYAFMARENPDLDDDQAKQAVLDNIEIELERNTAMRPLQAISGSLGEDVPGENPQAGKPQGPVAMRGKPAPAAPKPKAMNDNDWSYLDEVISGS